MCGYCWGGEEMSEDDRDKLDWPNFRYVKPQLLNFVGFGTPEPDDESTVQDQPNGSE